MSSAESVGPQEQPEDSSLPREDVRLSAEDRRALQRELAKVYNNQRAVERLLRETSFPPENIPPMAYDADEMWDKILLQASQGRMQAGHYQILRAALQPPAGFPHNTVFRRLAATYLENEVFQTAAHGQPARSDTAGSWRVLVMGASPAGVEKIGTGRDAKAILEANRGHLQVEQRPAASATDLRHVLDFRPDILHLACHGDGEDLIFEDIQGEEHRVPARDVADTLELYRSRHGIHLRGLVLASCDGAGIAAHFTGVAERVVSHRGVLDDRCAVVFTKHLYEALEHTPDLGEAARLAAQHALLTDPTCANVVTSLVIFPPDGG